ncbi:DUF1232 domain-containing protein [Algoriphagus sp. CAU 1675]|uniref:YkvA family protein n=1 Tax=Algoriphagus sp. CAU 1675 TaxID=3032597 RepID=UPI0023D9B86E|nr:DUF1232 domain-containing protein [Algoriphagus sp. CAU 1675]MDF2158384.1 DUF1232 domain-containing protein [Algoriphagus sp. CAU 1675]
MTTLKTKATILLEKAKAVFGRQVDAILRQEHKVMEVVSGVGRKLAKLGDHPTVRKVVEPLSLFSRMLKAHFSGAHKLSGSTLGLIILALVYFLSPFDLAPDFLGALGFADDLSVILAVYAKIKDEISEFLDWERTQK